MCAGGHNDGREKEDREVSAGEVHSGPRLDRIGIGEYRTCITFDSGDGVKVRYKFLTGQDLQREPDHAIHG